VTEIARPAVAPDTTLAAALESAPPPEFAEDWLASWRVVAAAATRWLE
jgi:hypothetical protein